MGHFPAPWGNEIRVGVLETVSLTVFLLVILFSFLGGMRRSEKDIEPTKYNIYCILTDLTMLSLIALVYTNDLFTAFVFIEINTLAAAGLAEAVVYHHDDDPATRLDLDAVLAEADAGVNVYVCGPQGFMDWVIGRAGAFGIDDARIHREFFSADVDVSGEAFEVVAERSGVTVSVGAEDTIAKALARAGVEVEVKCEEGVCGTCVTDVLDGEIDHRDHFLTADEREDGDQMCVCCSRARGKRLVLDL